MSIWPRIVLVTAWLSCLATAASAAHPTRTIDLLRQDLSGERLRGPVTIHLVHLNRLRYDIRVGVDVTYAEGPSPGLPFLPTTDGNTSFMKAADLRDLLRGGKGIPLAGACSPGDIVGQAIAIDSVRAVVLESAAWETIQKASRGANAVSELVRDSDDLLRGPAEPLRKRMTEAQQRIGEALAASWPARETQRQVDQLDRVQSTLSLCSLAKENEWTPERYERITKLIADIRARLLLVAEDSPREKVWRSAIVSLREWKGIVAAAANDGFTQDVAVDCSVVSGEKKETKVKLVRHDRLNPNASREERVLVTVECGPRLAITTGFGGSGVREQEFQIIPAPGGGEEIAFKKQRSRSIFPALLLHTRLWEGAGHVRPAMHFTIGAGVELRNSTDQTDPAWLLGASFSLWNTLFLTVADHMGKTTELADGYRVGDAVPAGTSTAPTVRRRDDGLALLLSYRLR